MGKELRKFVKSRRNYNTEVSLKRLMTKCWKESSQPPLLIVDGLSYVKTLYGEPEHWVYGTQWKHYTREVEAGLKTLIENLENISPLNNSCSGEPMPIDSADSKSVNILFYFNSSAEDNTSHDVSNKRLHQLQWIRSAFSELKNDRTPYKYPLKRPFGMLDYARYILKYECNCEVYIFLSDAHREISRLAKENPACFGIMSEDCEYLIYDTKPLLFTKSLNVDKMTVKTYSNAELARAVKLSSSQLKLLSCALGNAVISPHLLREFHQKIAPNLEQSGHIIVNKVAKCIKDRKWEDELWAISKMLGIEKKLLSKGLSSYDLQNRMNDQPYSEGTENMIRFKCLECKIPADIYSILCHNKYVEGLLLEDPEDENIPSSSMIFRPMRQRMYSVLFEGKQNRISEWCGYRNFHLEEAEMVETEAIQVKGKVPCLNNLWCARAPQALRWNLFVLCLGVTIPVSDLQDIELHYVTLCCVLNYLREVKEIQLKNWEIKAFICQALHPLAKDVNFIQRIQLGVVCPRAVSLASIFLRGISNAINILGTCGLPFPIQEAMPWKYFDGKLFHYCYRYLHEKQDSNAIVMSHLSNDILFGQFKKLYQIVTQGI